MPCGKISELPPVTIESPIEISALFGISLSWTFWGLLPFHEIIPKKFVFSCLAFSKKFLFKIDITRAYFSETLSTIPITPLDEITPLSILIFLEDPTFTVRKLYCLLENYIFFEIL